MRAPGEPIVHHRTIVREEIPAPPRPPPPVEISPAPRFQQYFFFYYFSNFKDLRRHRSWTKRRRHVPSGNATNCPMPSTSQFWAQHTICTKSCANGHPTRTTLWRQRSEWQFWWPDFRNWCAARAATSETWLTVPRQLRTPVRRWHDWRFSWPGSARTLKCAWFGIFNI